MSYSPPRQSRTFLVLADVARRTRALPSGRALALVAAMLVATASLDVAFGDQLSPFLFYLTAIGIASWRFGERSGFAIVATATLLSVLGDVARSAMAHGFAVAPPRAAVIWGETLHLGAAILFVLVVAGVRRALEHEHWLATTDPLTGALNRAAFDDRLEAFAAARTRGTRGGLALLAYVDLDGFKALNDARGHAAGDACLRQFAGGAVDAMAAKDVFARTGGDEFALLAAVPGGEEGEVFARRVHKRLAAVLAEAGCGVTCSVGALIVPRDATLDVAALVAAADALMYEAKRAGKDTLRVGFAIAPEGEKLSPPRLRLVVSDAA